MPELPTSDKNKKIPSRREGIVPSRRRGLPTPPREGRRDPRPARPMPPDFAIVEGSPDAPVALDRRGCPEPDEVVSFAMGLLDAGQAAAVRGHMGLPPEDADATIGRDEPSPGCPGCRAEYRDIRAAFDECFRDPFARRQRRPETPTAR